MQQSTQHSRDQRPTIRFTSIEQSTKKWLQKKVFAQTTRKCLFLKSKIYKFIANKHH